MRIVDVLTERNGEKVILRYHLKPGQKLKLPRLQKVEQTQSVWTADKTPAPGWATNAHFILGKAYETGDKAKAVRYYERSLTLNPGNTFSAAKLKELQGSQ